MNFEDLWNNGAQFCEHCHGYGSSLKEEQDRCSVCGGTGVKACPSFTKLPEAENGKRIARKVEEIKMEGLTVIQPRKVLLERRPLN
jgi:RecJ-like exonuclease